METFTTTPVDIEIQEVLKTLTIDNIKLMYQYSQRMHLCEEGYLACLKSASLIQSLTF